MVEIQFDPRRTYSPNQLVAYNVGRARALRGWTQEQTAEELAPFLGRRWSRASYSAVERATGDARVKQFSIDELIALARGFRLPVLWFLLPPSMEEDPGLSVPDGTSQGLEFTDYLKILFGESETERLYEDALQHWISDTTLMGLAGTGIHHLLNTIKSPHVQALVTQTLGDVDQAEVTLRRALDVLDGLRSIVEHQAAPDDTSDHQATPVITP